ncbi:MAG: hypothetical protein JWN63_3106 [Candidatus Acidoferrum typicum]|nr:hypothetical protein [Candidatus Acidoferrum typicum]
MIAGSGASETNRKSGQARQMPRTRIRVITHLSNLSVFDGWLGFHEFADGFGIIHPEISGAPGAIRTPDLWFRGPAPQRMFWIRLARFCTLSLILLGVRWVSDRNRTQLFLLRLAFGTNLRRADSIFFIISSFALRRLTGATIQPRTRPYATLVSDGNSRSIAKRMAFSPVSAKVAPPFIEYGRSESRPRRSGTCLS